MTDLKTVPKPIRQTWINWLGPVDEAEAIERAAPLLRKEELLDQLSADGVEVTDRNLMYWQHRDVLPAPTKSRSGRSTIAMYPSWMPAVIKILRFYQNAGANLQTIQTMMRETVAREFGKPLTPEGKAAVVRDVAQREFRRRLDQIQISLAQAVIDFDTATNLTTGTVEIKLHPLTAEQVEENLLNHAIRFVVTHPKLNYISDSDDQEHIFHPMPDLTAQPVTWSNGFVWKVDEKNDESV